MKKTRKHRTISPHVLSGERWVVHGTQMLEGETVNFKPRAFFTERAAQKHVDSVRNNQECHIEKFNLKKCMIEKVVHERQKEDGTWEVADA